MNVLILTPDRVGSTMLQRMITIYMALNNFDRPVINLHELCNGIIKYYSNIFNCEILGKPKGDKWGYYQTMPEILELIKSVDHYITSRMALYHIQGRKDSIEDQLSLYRHLNKNFFVISARRDNLFEHGLSWCIFDFSKKLNVYSVDEKLDTFREIYRHRIIVDLINLEKHLNRYRDYLNWCDTYFNVGSYYHYDRDLERIEDYILNLPVFNNTQKITWKQAFDIDFSIWNRVHYYISDISGIGTQATDQKKLEYNQAKTISDFELQCLDEKDKILSCMSSRQVSFMKLHAPLYLKSKNHINELIDNKVIISGVPIKLQTLVEKKMLIKNFKECVDFYNEWSEKNNLGKKYTLEDIDEISYQEIENWHIKPMLN